MPDFCTFGQELPFERRPEVLREAQNWGLLSPDPDIPSFLRLQPIFPYFLRSRLQEPAQAEVKQAVEMAFREYYQRLGATLDNWLTSQDAQQRQVGQLLAGLEYENLVTALNLALEAQASITGYHNALLHYLIARQDPRRALALFQAILDRFERYPAEKLAGPLGFEFANVLGTTANRQFDLKQYTAAESSYQKILQLVPQVAQLDHEEAKRLQATTYHQLGRVAQEQRKFEQAEQYYQQALQLYEEYNDRYGQADTYHNLGIVAQEQRQFAQAEQYYRQALQIDIEYNNRYSQAATYHQLGRVAQEQRQWEKAAHYYQQALEIYSEYNDRYEQAGTYGQLGILEREREQWAQAREYLLRALEIYVDYQDDESIAWALRNLALLWQSSHDAELPAAIAPMLGASREEIEALLRKYVE